MKWMDLSSFGAELKKVELDNGSIFPALVITDIEKYNQSGAVSLAVIKSENNPTSFAVLPGGRTGRAFNSPTLLMVPTIKDGISSFKIRDGLSKLLNIGESEVEALTTEMPDDHFTLKNGFMDQSQFDSHKEASAQKFYGTTLYFLKHKEEPLPLSKYKENISNEQHGMFPIGNIANIPFDSLAKFGLNSSIFDRAFINEQDALKAGYTHGDLKPVRLYGDTSILPVSMNKDNSVNIISDMNAVTQLAYSNFEWKKNLNIIQDYNTLLATRELTRDVLNARLSTVINAVEMEAHLAKMSITLQNINALNNVSKTYKTIKFNNKGVATLLMKNQQGEWRYIEKNGPTRLDQPLTRANYLKVIEHIGNANHVIVDVLALKLMNDAQRKLNMVKVNNRHSLLFKQFVVAINDPKFNAENHIALNINGSRIPKTFLDTEIRKFDPDIGGELYSRQVENLLAEISDLQDSNALENIVGKKFNDEQSLAASLKVIAPAEKQNEISSNEKEHDILAVAGFFNGSLKTTIDDAGLTRVQLGEVQAAAEKAVLQKDFKTLPKGISPAIDNNYEEAHNIYGALQHISLSIMPWLNKEIESLQKQKEQLFDNMTLQHISALAGSGPIVTRDDLDKMDDLIRSVESKLEIEKIKENILTYQLGRLIPNSANFTSGFAAFDSDANGNYIPFSSDTQYLLTISSLKNEFEKKNAYTGGPTELNNPVLARLADYVETQYKRTAMPIKSIATEIATAADSILSVNYSFTDIDFNAHLAEPLALSTADAIEEHARAYEIIASYVAKYQHYDSTSEFDCNPLDTALVFISRMAENYRQNTFSNGAFAGTAYTDAVLRQYEKYDYGATELSNDDQLRFSNPGTSIKLTDIEKLAVLKEIYSCSLAELSRYGEEGIIAQHLQSGQDFAVAYTKANDEVSDLDGDYFHKDLAGKFLVSYQTGNIDDKGLPSSENSYAYAITGDQPYKVINVSAGADLPENYIRLNSSSFNEALKDTFAVFQINSVAAVYGIKPQEVQLISAYIAALREQNFDTALELSENIFGMQLAPEDFKALTYEKSIVLDSAGNRPIIIKTPNHGSIEFEPSVAGLMIAKVALTNQLAGYQSSFDTPPIIKGLGNLNHFVAVHKYLTPSVVESQVLAQIQHSENYSRDSYSQEAAENTYQKSISHQAAEAGVSLIGRKIHIVMNQPETSKDLAIARVVPSEWNIPVGTSDRLRSFDVVSIESISEGKEILGPVVAAVMEHGVNGAPIVPKFANASIGIPETPAPLSKLQDAVLNKGQGILISNRALNDEYLDFYSKYATAALTDAFANLPDSVRNHTDRQLAGENKHSLPVNMFIEETTGIKLPRIRFLPENAEYPIGFKLADQLSTGSIIRMVDPREDRRPAFKLSEYDTDNLPSNNKLDAIRAFAAIMNRAGFDLNKYEAAVMRETVDHEKSKVFHLAFGTDFLKSNELADFYGQHLNAELLDIRANHPDVATAHVRLSNELTKPYIIVGPGETSDPLSFTIPVHSTQEECKKSMMLLHSIIGQRTTADIINNIKPVKIKQGAITEASLAVIAGNFREQAKALSGTNFVDSKLDASLKSSPLWVKSDGQNIEITMAASQAKADVLKKAGMVAIYNHANYIHSGTSPLNALHLSLLNLSRDGLDGYRLAAQLNALEPSGASKESATALTIGDFVKMQLGPAAGKTAKAEPSQAKPLRDLLKEQLFSKEAEANTSLNLTDAFTDGKVAAGETIKEVIKFTVQEKTTRPQTEFVEKFNSFPVSELNVLTSVDLRARILTNNLWPTASPAEHAASAHQNLDTYVLSKLIRDNIPSIPALNLDNDSVLQVAKARYFEVKELHSAVSKSQNTADLLANFREAHRQIIKVNPEYLDPYRQQLANALLKAAALNESGLGVVESLKDAAREVPYFKILYSKCIMELAPAEKLTGAEKSFAHALDGYALDDRLENYHDANQAFFNRFKESPIPGGMDLSPLTNAAQSGVSQDILLQIDSLNRINFDHAVFAGDLQAKWGVKLHVHPSESQYAQGYGKAVDNALTEIYEQLGGRVNQNQIGLGLTIEAVSKPHSTIQGAVRLLGVDELSVTKMKEAWGQNVLDKVYAAEFSQMTAENKSMLSGLQEKCHNMVDMVVSHGYKPKTAGLEALAGIYQQLQNGFDGVEKPPASESILSQIRIDFTEKLADFRHKTEQFSGDPQAEFTNFFYNEMLKKQDLIFETIENRMVKSIPASLESGDLYPFKSIESNLQKVFSINSMNSKSFINKFVEVECADKEKAEKDEVTFELQGTIQDSPLITEAIETLEYRASMRMVELLEKHAPEYQKNASDFAKQIKDNFPLIAEYIRDNSEIDQYQSAFARKYADFHARSDMAYKHHEDHDSFGASKGCMINHFIGLAFNNQDYCGLTLNEAELPHASKLVGELLSTVSSRLEESTPILEKTLNVKNDLGNNPEI